MKWKSIFILILFISSVCLWRSKSETVDLKASSLPPVQNINSGLRYSTIQAAINAPETLNGHTILVEEGIYNEHVTVNKSISLIGTSRNGTIIDGNGTGNVVAVSSDNVTIDGFTMRNGTYGIYVNASDNFAIIQCNASCNNGDGIHIRYSQNFTIENDIVGNNTNRGLFVTNSLKFAVNNNLVFGSEKSYGLNVNASANGMIMLNNVYENFYDGIGLGWDSTNCTVFGNTVYKNQQWGIWVDSNAENNMIYHNNIIGNGKQATSRLFNHWNNSVEGNYWSNYTGVDLNQDGIGDTPHVIDANNTDYHPLMGRFSSFTAFNGYKVNIISNSTINEFKFLKSASKNTIEFKVSNTTMTQKIGFCRVSLLHELMKLDSYNVTVDDVTPPFKNYTLYDDGYSRWIYFAYNQSTNTVIIEGTGPLDTTPPIVLINSPLNTTYPASALPLTFTVNEPTSWIGYSIDDQANITINGNVTLPVLPEGTHSIKVYANDTSGNMGYSNAIRFAVDASPPSVVILSPENKTYTTVLVTLNFTVNESTFWIGYSLDGSANRTITGNLTFVLADGSHHVTVYAEDLVGNIGASQTVYFSVNTKSQQSWIEAFLMWIVVALAVIAVCLGILAYFLRSRKKSRLQKIK